MKLELLLLYSIHAAYGRRHMTEMQESLNETSVIPSLANLAHWDIQIHNSPICPWCNCPEHRLAWNTTVCHQSRLWCTRDVQCLCIWTEICTTCRGLCQQQFCIRALKWMRLCNKCLKVYNIKICMHYTATGYSCLVAVSGKFRVFI